MGIVTVTKPYKTPRLDEYPNLKKSVVLNTIQELSTAEQLKSNSNSPLYPKNQKSLAQCIYASEEFFGVATLASNTKR